MPKLTQSRLNRLQKALGSRKTSNYEDNPYSSWTDQELRDEYDRLFPEDTELSRRLESLSTETLSHAFVYFIEGCTVEDAITKAINQTSQG